MSKNIWDIEEIDYHDVAIVKATRGALRHSAKIKKQVQRASLIANEVLGLSQEKLQKRIELTKTKLRSRPLVEELIRRSVKFIRTDPSEAERIGRIAVQLLIWIPQGDPTVGGRVSWWDLWALAKAELGNVLRVRCSREDAHQLFRQAYLALEKGSGDLEIEARILSLHGSLLKDTGAYPQAADCFRRSAVIYRRLKKIQEYARVRLKQAGTLLGQGEPAAAIKVQFDALEKLDEFKEPIIAFGGWCGLAEMHLRAGSPENALGILSSVEEELETHPQNSLLRAYWQWLGGQAHLAAREDVEAERCLLAAKAIYNELGDTFEAGKVGLGLMKLYCLQGRLGVLLEIVSPTIEALKSQDLALEVLEAVRVLVQSFERRDFKSHLIDQVLEAFNRCDIRCDPR